MISTKLLLTKAMLKNKNNFLAIIPARKGSKRIKNKNKILFKGKKLVEHSINAAIKSKLIDNVVISSDDKDILSLTSKYKDALFLKRKKSLCTDKAKTTDVVYDLVMNNAELKSKYIVLLQPTSPLRTVSHIDKAIKMILRNEKKYDSVISVNRIEEPHPYKIKKIVNGKLVSFIKGKSSEVPRQELPGAYLLNGAIYIIKTKVFMKKKSFFSKTLPYIMNEKYSLNLDTPLDLKYLSMLA